MSTPLVYVLEACRAGTWVRLDATGKDGSGTFTSKQGAIRFATDLAKWPQAFEALRVTRDGIVVWPKE